MLDRYWRADANRISPEAPVPVAKISNTQDRMGGAANVAQNISALGGAAELLGVAGNDAEGLVLESLLRQYEIRASIVKSDDIRTTSKIRVVSRNQQLIRLDFDDSADQLSEQVSASFEKCLDNNEIVILSDYGKGVLSDPQAIIGLARERGKKVVVDPKGMISASTAMPMSLRLIIRNFVLWWARVPARKKFKPKRSSCANNLISTLC